MDGPSESSEADDDTKPRRRGRSRRTVCWPSVSESVGSRRSRVGAMRSLNPRTLSLNFSLSLSVL